jgi:hypothetical protein
MANWRQIQGRIRRAKTSADPVGKLSELYQKTRDGMVAFEAATFEEKAGHADEAVRWFTTAAERFRRAEWRQKAAEALTRLGAPVPEFNAEVTPKTASETQPANGGYFADSPQVFAEPEPGATESSAQPPESAAQEPAEPAATAAPGGHRKRRRGRRGGRRHKRRGTSGAAAGAAAISTSSPSAEAVARSATAAPSEIPLPAAAEAVPIFARGETETSQFAERATYIRAGEPALASRFAQLESLLRRLISGPLHRVDEVEGAPAGPGVFLLSDSDLTTNYYIEACQTLRVGAAQLVRAGRAGRGAREHGNASLRAQMAEHLGISDAKVSDYLKKHCVVRWLQLDTDAPHLAHFAIAVLRPVLNTE